jgi:hypothetical protein
VSPEVVAKTVSCGPSPERHLEAIDRYLQAGYDHIILVQVGPDQDAFFDLFERNLAPALRDRASSGVKAGKQRSRARRDKRNSRGERLSRPIRI